MANSSNSSMMNATFIQCTEFSFYRYLDLLKVFFSFLVFLVSVIVISFFLSSLGSQASSCHITIFLDIYMWQCFCSGISHFTFAQLLY